MFRQPEHILPRRLVVDTYPLGRLGLRNGNLQYGRLILGQIQSINRRTGVADVLLPSLAEVKKCHIKMDSCFADGFRSSWQRTMPQTGAMVLVYFDHVNNGYILTSSMFFTDNDQSVEKDINKLYNSLTRQNEENNPAYTDWRVLEEGEIDARSSGGCYFHMGANGVYSFYAGKTFSKINRDRNEYEFDSDLFRIASGLSEYRFGDVKRKSSVNELRDSHVVNESIQNHEFSYRLRSRAPSEALSANILSFRSGNVYNWNNKTLSTSSAGSPIRLKLESYAGTAPSLPPTFDLEIDASGNVALNTSQVNTRFSISTGEMEVTTSSDFKINSLGNVEVTTAQSATFRSTSDFSITSGGTFTMTSTGNAAIRAPQVSIGIAPAGGVVLGPALSTVMSTAANVFTSQGSVVIPLAAAAQSAAAGAGVGVPNPGSNLAAINALAAAVTALAAASQATGGAMTSMAASTTANATSTTVTVSA